MSRAMADPIYLYTKRRGDPQKLAQSHRVEILQQLPLFDGVAKRHIRHFARLTRIEQFGTDQDLLKEGEPSTVAFALLAGTAVVRKKGRKVAELGPGDLAGELGLLLERPRASTVRSTSPVECLALDRRALKAAVVEFPEFGWRLLETVAQRLSE
jgi:CRP/FNR family cyclic AMP-dependent transcriptional regulator